MTRIPAPNRPALWLPAVLSLAIASFGTVQAPAAVFQLNGQRFTVPDGFTVELAADTNVLRRPVSASFDDQGRLYVTDSSGSNEAPQKQLANPTHRVLRLASANRDGHFDRSDVFAEKVMFPQGCLWHDGAVYVAGPPSIWKFTTSQPDGMADRREEWFKGGTLTGCANDIHGPYLGPDGYIYWTKGAFSEQTHPLGNGRVLKDRAAHIYRARPDGSDLDVIMSGGMDNPVEIAFTRDGEALFTSTFIDFSQPGFRDGIGHAVWGGVFGKVNDVLEDGAVKRTSPDLMHPFFEAGPAAECALMRYQNTALGVDYRDNLFATSFNLRKVTRHILRKSGATFASTDSDFLVSDSQDFHPTDVLEDADGSLLVVDTGGWYKLCCPSAQLSKPDLFGAIYRVRRTDAPRLEAKEWTQAYRQLTASPEMSPYDPLTVLKRAAWRTDTNHAGWFREIITLNAKKAANSDSAAHLTRVAAEGLGRLRAVSGVPVLLEATPAATHDPVLQHSLIYALIQIAAPAETRAGLRSDYPAQRRAALIALDQMDGGNLGAEELLPSLGSPDADLRSAAIWILRRHPAWAPAAAGLVDELLSAAGPNQPITPPQLELLRILAAAPAVQNKLAERLPSLPLADQVAVLRTFATAEAREYSPAWVKAVLQPLNQSEPGLLRAGLAAARAIHANPKRPGADSPELKARLLTLAGDGQRTTDLRLEALLAGLDKDETVDQPTFDLLLAALDAGEPAERRGQALELVRRAKLDVAELEKLTTILPRVSPLELPRLLGAFEQSTNEQVGRALLAALHNAQAAKNVPAGNLKNILAKYPASVQQELADWLPSLDGDVAKKAAHLEALLTELQGLHGEVRRGQAVFNSPKASCLACHQVGYLGGQVGPDLTSIGQARSERDLLESVVYPSASFVRSFEPVIVATREGEEHTGVLKSDSAAEIVLATGPNALVHIPRAEVKEMRPGMVSIMPQGLDEQLTRQELADLLAFLKDTRWGSH